MDELQVKGFGELTEVKKSEQRNDLMQKVQYLALDEDHYSFICNPYENVTVNMEESYYDAVDDVFSDVEYEESLDDDTKVYYALAASSGLITGALDAANILQKIDEIIDKVDTDKWKDYIVAAAKLIGYKKNDFNGASKYLIERSVTKIADNLNVDELLSKSVHCLNMHPSYAGLFCSILSQFKGERYSITKDGRILKAKLPDYYAIGKNREEKLVYGFLYFVFYLAVDEVVSNRNILNNINLPKDVIKIIKQFVDVPIIKKIPGSFEETEKAYSELLVKIFKKNEYKDSDGNVITFDFSETVTEAVKKAEGGIIAVVLNDCITRGIYVVKKLIFEFKINDINCLADLEKINLVNVVPYNNRLLSRMSLISSGTFVAVNIGKAVAKCIVEKKAGKHDYLGVLLTEVNIAGIGKFIYHVSADSKYIKEDIKVFFEKFKKKKAEGATEQDINVDENIFRMFELNPVQTRLLYSLETVYVEHDIKHTKKKEDAEKKKQWLNEWKQAILRGFCIDSEQFLVNDEDFLYQGIFELAKYRDNWDWFYLLTIEMALFDPYREIGSRYDKDYKKLKVETDYIKDVFIRRQTIVSQEEVDNILKNYAKYKSAINGSAKNVVMGLGITAFVALATGGAAFMFAPQIAIAVAGEAVAGLHGAALVNASLAFVGGGSLAAGGLGMAGGTAIITGSGAMLGLASSGTTSIVTFMKQVSSDFWVRQSAKMLTFCNCLIDRELDDKEFIGSLKVYLERTTADIKKTIDLLSKEDNDLEKENIEKLKEYNKYLSKCLSELTKMDDKAKK